MNVSELTRRRNFATFELGDNVTQLSERLLSDLAAVGGVSIRGCHEDPMCLSTLATAIDELSEDGTCEIEALPLLQATAYVQRSGIMGLKKPRGLQVASATIDPEATWVVDTSNANWLDATVAANFPIRKRPKIPNNSIFIPAQRRMGRADEALNPEIARYRNTHQQRLAPTEQDFYFGPTHRHLIENGFATALDTIVRETLDVLDETDRSKDDDLLPYIAFFKDREDLVDEDHVVHGVGAAGLLLACKLRMAGIITQGNWFDSSLEAPQVVIAPPTEMPLANNEDELRDPTKLSPYSALSTLARAGRWMIKAGISSL